MTAQASRMRSITAGGERWVSVADMVTMFRDMADSLSDGGGKQSLTVLVEAFAPMLGPRELLPASDKDIQPEPCSNCGERVVTLGRHGSDEPITLRAKSSIYGPWMVVSPVGKPPLAVKFDQRRPGAKDLARYREHSCPRQAVTA